MIVTNYEDPTAIDPRPTPLDDELRRLCATFRTRPAGIRNSLTTDDFYTLLAFARRAAVFAIRGRDAVWIADGLTAVAMIDDERIEPAALAPELGLLQHAAERIGAGNLFAEAAARATRGVARMFRAAKFFGYEEIATGFVRRDANDYRPSRDLLPIALEIRAILQRDDYRVDDVVIGTSLPDARANGVITIGARRRDDPRQIAIAFLAEGASRAAPPGDAAHVAVVAGNLLCLLIASHETSESLQRFAEPIRRAL